MKSLGIDLAAQDHDTAVCVIDWATDKPCVAELRRNVSDKDLIDQIEQSDRAGIDAPFGWPDEFVDAVVGYRGGVGWPSDARQHDLRAQLSYRLTDRFVIDAGSRPLSVATDKIAIPAMRCAHLLVELERRGAAVDRSGLGRVLEVYPAAALAVWGFDAKGYKRGAEGRKGLTALVERLLVELPWLRLSDHHRSLCLTSDDAFDALVCALISRAAALGRTRAPPPEHAEQARREGWIHMPEPDSLGTLGGRDAKRKGGVQRRAQQALRGRLVELRGEEVLDGTGRVERAEQNFLTGIGRGQIESARSQLAAGDGAETKEVSGLRPKLHSAWSSSALVVNTFAPWLGEEDQLELADQVGFDQVTFERKCPIGRMRGKAPNLDLVAESAELIVGVESKCTEYLAPHAVSLADTYEARVTQLADDAWRAAYEALRAEHEPTYRYLDVAQLLKHYLGLVNCFGGTDREVVLVYLYWMPEDTNGAPPPFRQHAEEIKQFSAAVAGSRVRFVPEAYPLLWARWELRAGPRWLSDHVVELRRRYAVTLGS